MRKIIILLLFVIHYGFSFAQLNISTSLTPTQLVQQILIGSNNNLNISNVKFTGDASQIGSFTTGAKATTLGITSGIVISTGKVTDVPGDTSIYASTKFGNPGISDFVKSYDAAVLEFDFIPTADTIKFQYVFGSEEYLEYVGGKYNDIFSFFITGPKPANIGGGTYSNTNIALIPNTTTPVSINNVNTKTNSQYFNMASGGKYIAYNFSTKLLTAYAVVIPCQTYHLRIAIADIGDGTHDSGVFLKANSFTTNAVTVSQSYSNPKVSANPIEGCNNATITFNIPNALAIPFTINYTVKGTATNGVDYNLIPTSVTIPAGQTSASITIIPIADGIVEGNETIDLEIPTLPCLPNSTISLTLFDADTPPTIIASPSRSTCGNAVNISATATSSYESFNYKWNNGDTTSQISVSPTQTTNYTVTATGGCGNTLTSAVAVNFVNTQNISLGNDTTICYPNKLKLDTKIPNANYAWTPNNEATQTITVSSTGTYSVTATIAGGCNSIGSIKVTVDKPQASISTNGQNSICLGDSITLKGSGGISYKWSTNDTTQNITVKPFSESTYSLSINDGKCKDTAHTTISILPVPFVNLGSNKLICPGDSVTFDAGTSIFNYQWSNGEKTPSITVSDSGKYTITVSSVQCGSAKDSVRINTYIPTPINLGKDSTGCIQNIVLEVPNTFSKYAWSTGDQFYKIITSIPGTYSITVTDNNGCKSSDTVLLKDSCSAVLFVPNAFTPNNDGLNDFFIIQSHNITTFNIFIFSRWGEQIFSSENINDSWDGKYKGKEVSVGIYYYIITYTDLHNNKGQKLGSVMLLY